VTKAVRAAMQMSPEELPVYPRRKSPRVPLVVAGRVKALKKWRDKQAEKLAIDPALILTKALINAIAVQKPLQLADLSNITELKNWQRKEFGQDIVQVMKRIR
jgi:ribonuclease D